MLIHSVKLSEHVLAVSEAYVMPGVLSSKSTRPSVLPDLSNNHWKVVSTDMHHDVPAKPISNSFTSRVNAVFGTRKLDDARFLHMSRMVAIVI